MFFLLDHDVDVAVAAVLRKARYRCEPVGAAGLALADDDDISVYADDRGAALLTHDRELIRRRKRNTFGRHVHLACREWEAAGSVGDHLSSLVELLGSRDAIVVRLTVQGVKPYRRSWIG